MNYTQNNLGNCKFCGAPNVQSPQTGKIFCSEKCWLRNQPQQRYNQPRRQYQRQEPDWDAISERDFLQREWTAAKISAKDIVVALITKDKLETEKIKPAVKDLAEYLYGLKQPKEEIEENYEGV